MTTSGSPSSCAGFRLGHGNLKSGSLPKSKKVGEKTEKFKKGWRRKGEQGHGLPDGIFAYQEVQFRHIFRVLAWIMLVYFISIWYIYLLFPFVVCRTKKNPATLARKSEQI
jgi:hypothetical protein